MGSNNDPLIHIMTTIQARALSAGLCNNSLPMSRSLELELSSGINRSGFIHYDPAKLIYSSGFTVFRQVPVQR